ncbi:MAG TPA: LON peptidase substrate-binding domain-containing protein [bacterium]|nr:LON peptidase substrate-binding domain-containing protein [Candidatus Omnitrophota bacterium]HOJ61402.1 LON peptidase substrate-binding domain-containing protein [bacterium]HPP01112.1 LON peptidase substrate-binding domain-containing protein [bacterium]HXK92219.1 LON peptidase substrate-binding domain-containing protein [bacterium]
MSHEINLKHFSGKLPLFPLPNVVQFPHTILPLHIFEKRYRKMIKDVLEGERLIGMAVLQPGWEENYQGNPDIYPVACLGRVVKSEPLPNGRSNILLLGLKRVRIQTIITPFPYRTAKVEIVEDSLAGLDKESLRMLKRRLLELYSELVVEYAGSGKPYPALSHLNLEAGVLADALAATIGLPTPDLVYLLMEHRISARFQFLEQRLLEKLQQGGPAIFQQPETGRNPGPIHLN